MQPGKLYLKPYDTKNSYYGVIRISDEIHTSLRSGEPYYDAITFDIDYDHWNEVYTVYLNDHHYFHPGRYEALDLAPENLTEYLRGPILFALEDRLCHLNVKKEKYIKEIDKEISEVSSVISLVEGL